jgi:hypothetical protein
VQDAVRASVALEEINSERREGGFDRWPSFQLSPTDYERVVAELVRGARLEVADGQVRHLDPSTESMVGTLST